MACRALSKRTHTHPTIIPNLLGKVWTKLFSTYGVERVPQRLGFGLPSGEVFRSDSICKALIDHVESFLGSTKISRRLGVVTEPLSPHQATSLSIAQTLLEVQRQRRFAA